MLYAERQQVAGTSKLFSSASAKTNIRRAGAPGAKRMEMAASMEGYIFVDPAPPDEQALRDWLELAVTFVKTLPPKLPGSKSRRTKTK